MVCSKYTLHNSKPLPALAVLSYIHTNKLLTIDFPCKDTLYCHGIISRIVVTHTQQMNATPSDLLYLLQCMKWLALCTLEVKVQ